MGKLLLPSHIFLESNQISSADPQRRFWQQPDGADQEQRSSNSSNNGAELWAVVTGERQERRG